MTRRFTDYAFSDAVKASQSRYGARDRNEELARAASHSGRDTITQELAQFIAARDSFFLATASRDGWPYVQHRGGPSGFLAVIDDRTLGFADYAGNKQYITAGNLSENPRAMIFLVDYANRRRIKLWGEARIVDDDDALVERLMPQDYRARPERAILFNLLAWDINCPQHIPQLFGEADIEAASAAMLDHIAELEAALEACRRGKPKTE